MKRLTLEQKALRVIEWMVSDDASEDTEITIALGREISREQGNLMAKKVGEIYILAHGVIPEHSCYNVHGEWRDRVLSLYKSLRKKNLL